MGSKVKISKNGIYRRVYTDDEVTLGFASLLMTGNWLVVDENGRKIPKSGVHSTPGSVRKYLENRFEKGKQS